MKKEATSEVAVAKANIKKMTVQIASLQQALQQKAWYCAQLSVFYTSFATTGARETGAHTDM